MRTQQLLLLTLAAACSNPPAPSAEVRDSAGVRIRVYASVPGQLAEWSVDSTPTLILPTYGPDSVLLLPSPVGAMRTSRGELIVADRGSSSVKVFDRAGSLLRTIGRAGTGPGEFDFIAGLSACGSDTAYVQDIGNRRVSRIADDGSASSLTLGFRPQQLPYSLACTRSGQVLMIDWPDLSTRLEAGPYRPTVIIAAGTTAQPVTTTLGSFPGTEMVVKGRGISPRALGRWLRIAVTDSTRWVAVNEGPFVRGYDLGRQLRFLVNPALTDRPVPGTEWAFQRRRAMDSAGAEAGRERVGQLFDASAPPDRLPWVHALMVDSEGSLWIHPFPRADEPNPAWRVLSSDGTWRARIQLPDALTGLWEIGRDYVLGFREDADGAIVVVQYALHRT